MIVVELEAIENREEVHDGKEVDAISWNLVERLGDVVEHDEIDHF